MTVQLEHGQRMHAKPHSKEYGSFSCYVQYYGEVKKLFNIPPTAFHPRPKVQSCFVQWTPFPGPKIKAAREAFLFQMIRQAFQQRRKTILNSLSSFIGRERLVRALKDLHLDPCARAENLSLKDYIMLANTVGILEPEGPYTADFPSQPSNQRSTTC